MKLGASISSVAHIAILAWGVVSFNGPKEFVVADVEALPIDIVPIESVTKTVAGDLEASKQETPAPKPTKKPDVVDEAVNVGEAESDQKSQTEAPPKPIPVEKPASASTPDPKPEQQKPTPEPEQQQEEAKKDTPVPTNELASLNQEPAPVQEAEQKIEEAKPEASEQFEELPQKVPVPVARPQRTKPKPAKTTERKTPEEQTREKKKADASSEQSTNDQIAALLNKADAAASGAKRSQREASLGTKKGSGEKLSQSEMDALRGAIEQCWNVPIGISDAEDMRVTITMNLSKDGALDGRPKVAATGGETRARRAFAESARRAVMKCAPYNLPIDKYDTWSQVVVNFDPSQMF